MKEVIGDDLSTEVSVLLEEQEEESFYLSMLSSGLAFLRNLKAFVR